MYKKNKHRNQKRKDHFKFICDISKHVIDKTYKLITFNSEDSIQVKKIERPEIVMHITI